MGEFTNTIKDGEVTGYNPDATADLYKISDHNTDNDYMHEKICEGMKYMSTNEDLDCLILYGGVISAGAGAGQVSITAGAALTKDTSGNYRVVTIPALTDVTVPSGYYNGSNIWVVAEYESKLGSSTRNHNITAESYHYTLLDSYTGESDSDDLFTQTDPNAVADTIACFGCFTIAAGPGAYTYVSGERSPEYVVEGGIKEWNTDTAYVAGDVRQDSNLIYVCISGHTSGTFATDLASGYWAKFGYDTNILTKTADYTIVDTDLDGYSELLISIVGTKIHILSATFLTDALILSSWSNVFSVANKIIEYLPYN